MAKNNRGGRNNNPEGRNQFSNGWMDAARDNPLTTAAAVGGAVATGVFLWSRRNQISNQIGQLGDQISEWREGMRSGSEEVELEMAGAGDMGSPETAKSRGSGRSASNRTRGLSETGGGNASLGAKSGGAGVTAASSSRGRA